MSKSNSTPSDAQKAAQNRARAIVDWAKRRGSIQPPTDFECVDCGKPALVYDHRDYNKPLDVVPVCNGCNVKRGPGKPVDHLQPIKHSTGYTLDANGIQPVYFQCVDFEDPCEEPTLADLPSYPEELARLPARQPEPSAPQLWDAWR